MALRPCLADGCTELASATYCEQHRLAKRQVTDKRRGNRPWYHGDWARLRKQAIQKHPWCAWCGATADLTVDHVTNRSVADGLQVLCRKCNSAKG